MFDFEENREFLREENEIKPNLRTAQALKVAIIVVLVSLALNEMRIFRVDLQNMRVGCAISLLFALIPQFIVKNKRLVGSAITKYVIFACVCVITFTVESRLFIFAAPVCMFPMLVSVHYSSSRLSRVAIVVSGLITAVTPVLGCAFGLWENKFIEFLLRASIMSQMEFTVVGAAETGDILFRVALFISFPWTMCVGMFGMLLRSATKRNEDSIRDQIHIRNMNRWDDLTGLYNQNTYVELLNAEQSDGNVGVVFFDVDYMKQLNDRSGHEYGDLLLKHCAASLRAVMDKKCRGFRIGGDEFLLLIETDDETEIARKLEKWEKALNIINLENKSNNVDVFCHMSHGETFGPKRDLAALIAEADTIMYERKRGYHETAERS